MDISITHGMCLSLSVCLSSFTWQFHTDKVRLGTHLAWVGRPVWLDAIPSLEHRLRCHHSYIHSFALGIVWLKQQSVQLCIKLVSFDGDTIHWQLTSITGTQTDINTSAFNALFAVQWSDSFPMGLVYVKGKVFPYLLSIVGPRADPGILVTLRHPPGGRLPLLSTRPVVTFPAKEHHRL